jgi:hypothetical protein
MNRNALAVVCTFALAGVILSCDKESVPTYTTPTPTEVASGVPAGFKLVPEGFICTAPTPAPSPEPSPNPKPTPTPGPTPTPAPIPTPSPTPTPTPPPPPPPPPVEKVAFCHVSNKGAPGGDHNVQEQQMFADGVIPPGHVAHFTDPKFCPLDYVGYCDGRSAKVVCK